MHCGKKKKKPPEIYLQQILSVQYNIIGLARGLSG